MTLREIWQSVLGFRESALDFWDGYITEVTTQNVLDWSIGHLVMTAVGGLVLLGVAMAVLEMAWNWMSQAWEKTGLPYTMDRLDKRFGPLITGFIMVAGTVFFLAFIGVVSALLEMAFQ